MSSWNLTGNAGTIRSVNFLGTADDNPLVIATNVKGVTAGITKYWVIMKERR
jgi:hypothetical protein